MTEKKSRTQCHGIVLETGERCKLMTTDSTGYCPAHRDKRNECTEFAILKCSECPIDECAYRDSGPSGLCYFEMATEVKEFDERWKVVQAMREVLRTHYLLKSRLERALSRCDFQRIGDEGDNTQALLKELNMVANSLAAHLERFGKFMGWDNKPTENNQKEEKQKLMMKILKREEKAEEERIAENIPEAVAVEE